MRIRHVLAAVLCMLLLLPMQALAGEAPYYTMTETYDGSAVYSQNGYLPDGTFRAFDGKALKRPADLFVDEQDTLFISDEGNRRVIRCTDRGKRSASSARVC